MDKNEINSCPVPTGVLVVVGGHENKGEAPEKCVQEATSITINGRKC